MIESAPTNTAPPAGARRIAIAAGGTAGHVTPALAVAAAYRRRRPDVDLFFLGGVEGVGESLVLRAGHRLERVPARPWFGSSRWQRMLAFAAAARGALRARRILRARGVHLVLGFGGYATAGAVLAARSLGLPAAIHEANAFSGRANRLLGRTADRVFLGHAAAASAWPAGRCAVTGTPVRPCIAALGEQPRRPPVLAQRPARLLVLGGARGAAFFSPRLPPLLKALAARGVAAEVRHQIGAGDAGEVRAAYAAAAIAAQVDAFIDDIAAAYAWADVVIARAGASTIAELALVGLPSLLVPLSTAADDHQSANAAAHAAGGAALWVRESDWNTDSLSASLAPLLGDPEVWQAAAARARRRAVPAAADAIVDQCEEMLSR